MENNKVVGVVDCSSWPIYEPNDGMAHIFITINPDPSKIFKYDFNKNSKRYRWLLPEHQYDICVNEFMKVLNKIIKKGLGYNILYITPEYTKAGNIHIHCILEIPGNYKYDYWLHAFNKLLGAKLGHPIYSKKIEWVRHISECKNYLDKDKTKMFPLKAKLIKPDKFYFE